MPTEVFFHSSPSLDMKIKYPLFNLCVTVSCWLLALHNALAIAPPVDILAVLGF